MCVYDLFQTLFGTFYVNFITTLPNIKEKALPPPLKIPEINCIHYKMIENSTYPPEKSGKRDFPPLDGFDTFP